MTASRTARRTPAARRTSRSPRSPWPRLRVRRDNEFSFGETRKQKRKGKARITLDLPGSGLVELDGELVKHRRKHASGEGQLRLSITAAGSAKERLHETGRATIPAAVTFTPDGGDPRTKTRSVTLVRRR